MMPAYEGLVELCQFLLANCEAENDFFHTYRF